MSGKAVAVGDGGVIVGVSVGGIGEDVAGVVKVTGLAKGIGAREHPARKNSATIMPVFTSRCAPVLFNLDMAKIIIVALVL